MKKFSEQEKQSLVAQYQKGESVQKLCQESGVSKCALYDWIKCYQGIKSKAGQIVTPKELDSLKRRTEKLENIVAVLKTVSSSSAARSIASICGI